MGLKGNSWRCKWNSWGQRIPQRNNRYKKPSIGEL